MLSLASACVLAGTSACRRAPTEIVVFHAASLTRALGEASAIYEQHHPGVRIRLEPSGSQVAARKVAEQGLRADLVIVADAKLIQRILVPVHASFDVVFATNGLVIAHKDHSAFTTEISPLNWPQILLRPEVRLGRADPDTAPIGYHTILAWQLAERSGAYGDAGMHLTERLLSRCEKQDVVHDETELLAKLESRAVDYAFLYRSTAEDHRLKITELPAEQDLSRPDLADRYATAQLDVQMKQGEAKVRIQGTPITYGLTIPIQAPHRDQAALFAQFLLGEEGQSVFTHRGFRPMRPAACQPCEDVPPELNSSVGTARRSP